MSRLSVGRALRAPRVLTRLRSLLARPFGVALSRPRRRPTVTVYTRTNCGLCRRAEAVVVRVARGRADVELVDVDSDPELVARYTVRVPVVAIDGRELFEYEVDPRALRAA
ncbi:MAG: glutaredoxin family protein, partial [Actinomycetota bacterium]|nr:glutaredoxin family protein [Actinomycetota bacterium]